jgi:hypothetical protein
VLIRTRSNAATSGRVSNSVFTLLLLMLGNVPLGRVLPNAALPFCKSEHALGDLLRLGVEIDHYGNLHLFKKGLIALAAGAETALEARLDGLATLTALDKKPCVATGLPHPLLFAEPVAALFLRRG